MRKLWKGLAVLVALVLLVRHGSELSRFVPVTVWMGLFAATLTYGISLLFPTEIPVYRRWGIAYLAYTGIAYLAAGIVGLLPHSGLIEYSMWDQGLISPYPLLGIIGQCISQFPCAISRAPYDTMPLARPSFFPVAVVVASTIMIIAAFMMAGKVELHTGCGSFR